MNFVYRHYSTILGLMTGPMIVLQEWFAVGALFIAFLVCMCVEDQVKKEGPR